MKFPAFYGTRRFITAFTSARHLFLSWARLIQSMPPIPLLEGAFDLSFHLRLGLPSNSFPQISAPRSCMHLSCRPYVPHTPPISFFLIWSPEKYFVRNTEYKASSYVVFSTSPIPRPVWAQCLPQHPILEHPQPVSDY